MFKEPIVPSLRGCALEALLFVLIVVLLSVSLPGCADLAHYAGEKCASTVDCRRAFCEHAPDVCK